jgi:hypothetical protein
MECCLAGTAYVYVQDVKAIHFFRVTAMEMRRLLGGKPRLSPLFGQMAGMIENKEQVWNRRCVPAIEGGRFLCEFQS